MLVGFATTHVHILQFVIMNFEKARSLTYLKSNRIIRKLKIRTRDRIIDRCRNIILGITRRLMANNSIGRKMIIRRFKITYIKVLDI